MSEPAAQVVVPPEATQCPNHPANLATGTCDRCGLFICGECRTEALSAEGQQKLCPSCVARASDVPPKPIGGWLMLPALGLVFAPIRTALTTFTDLLAPWYAGTFAEAIAATPALAPVLATEVLMNLAVIAFTLYAAVAFFGRKRTAPRLMMMLFASSVVVQVLDMGLVLAFVPGVDAEPQTIFRPMIAAAVWIPYFQQSKRVKETFLK